MVCKTKFTKKLLNKLRQLSFGTRFKLMQSRRKCINLEEIKARLKR